MGFLRKLARDVNNATQNTQGRASTAAKVGAGAVVGGLLGQAIANRVPQVMPPHGGQPVPGQHPAQAPPVQAPQHHQAAPVAPAPQPQAPRGGVMENALAGLLGSAERFIDNAGNLIAICPKCQTPGAPHSACERCGTHVLPTGPPSQRAGAGAGANAANVAAGPRKCENCGATILGAICEYCSI